MDGRITRRQLIGTAGVGALGLGAARALGRHGSTTAPGMGARPAALRQVVGGSASQQQSFRSRTDLRPPTITIDVPAPPPQEGLPGDDQLILLAPYSGPPPWGLMIIDGTGELVWFHEAGPNNLKVANLRVQSYRGEQVLSWWEGHVTSLGYGLGDYLIYDDSYRQIARVRAANGLRGDHHEFRLTPQGTALFTIFREARRDLTSVGGPADGGILESVLQEVDVASGRLLMQWNSLEHVDIAESYRSYYGPIWDYMHANSIDLDEDGNLLVSARNTHTIYKLDRRTGRIIWRLGGKRSDFVVDSAARFAWQHDFARVGGGRYTVFNNAANGVDRMAPQSSGLLLEVDEPRRLVTMLQRYTHRPGLLCTSQGSVQALPSGEMFLGWGSEPNFTQYTHEGTTIFDGRLPEDVDSYRAYRTVWAGRPREPPALLVTAAQAGAATAYVSWNGATEVAAWRVLAGTSSQTLTPLASVARTGFETAIALSAQASSYAVEALDSDGQVLGRSAVVGLSAA